MVNMLRVGQFHHGISSKQMHHACARVFIVSVACRAPH